MTLAALDLPDPLTQHVVRDTLGTAIYFMVYESGKQIGNTLAGDHPNSNKVAVVAAGGMCGLVSWAMICKSNNVLNGNAGFH